MSSDPRQPRLSHVDASGRARMVDVGEKPVTERVAAAEALVRISPELERRIRENDLAKGDVLEVARLAGIQAAKRTSDLIPLCHTLALDHADVQVALENGRVRVLATVRTHARTGVEMEALTAAVVAALSVIGMGKGVGRAMRSRGGGVRW